MFFLSNKQVVILLLTLTQSMVYALSKGEKNRTKSSVELIFNYLQLPWIEGIEWLATSTESSDLGEVRALIQGVESGETWALQMFDNLLESQREIRATNIQDIKVSSRCVEDNAQDFCPDNRDDRCVVSLSTIPLMINGTDSYFSSACNLPTNDTRLTVQFLSRSVENDPKTDELGAELSTPKREEYEEFNLTDILAIFIFSTVCAFVLTCTICDFCKRFRPALTSATVDTLAKFSLFTNALALMSMKVTPDTMPAIHGLRCLSFVSIIVGHRYFATLLLLRNEINLLDILEWKNSWIALYIQTSIFMVDTFSVISGFLTAYLFLKAMKSGMKFNLLKIYLHRYLRLTPCLAVLMLFVVTVFHRVRDDAEWRSSIPFVVYACQQHWWSNLLFVQNFASNNVICLPHSWYLAFDMQLFFISPIVLYPMHRWPKFGLGILGSLLVVSLATPPILVALNGYFHAALRLDIDLSTYADNFHNYYIATFNRGVPYLVGISLGYDVAVKKRRLTNVNVITNWIITGVLTLFCLWGNHRVNNSNFAYDIVLEFAFALLARPFWSVAIAWTIYACTQGYGGLATKFLSLPVFLPLSRLSYCIYLVHVLLQINSITASSLRSDDLIVEIFGGIWSDLMFSTVAAFVLNLCFETPIIVLEKMLTLRDRRTQEATQAQEKTKIRPSKISE